MIFSYIMGNFIEMIDSYKLMNSEPDDGDNLSKFFGLMKKFNKGKAISDDLTKRMEAYFQYRWANNRMGAFDD